MKRYAWITNYRPFLLGGDIHAPIKCVVDATDEFDLEKGYKGFVFVAPNGKTFVCESETGAIIGSNIDEVREDIKSGDDKIMEEQMVYARKMLNRAYEGNLEEFYKRLRGM